MKKFYLLLSLAALIGLSSCSSLRIEKRHYNKGWYVDFGTQKNEREEAPADKTATVTESGATVSEEHAAPVASPTVSEEAPAPTAVSVNPVSVNPDVLPDADKTISDNEPVVNPEQDEKASGNNSALPGERPGSDVDQLVLIILAIFIPPLAVYLVQGVSTMFWITLICWLVGGAFLFGRFGYGYFGALGLLAIILAILVVLGKL